MEMEMKMKMKMKMKMRRVKEGLTDLFKTEINFMLKEFRPKGED
jgi:hypothetical protein